MEVDFDVDSLVGDSVCSLGPQLGPVHAFDGVANLHEHRAQLRHESRNLVDCCTRILQLNHSSISIERTFVGCPLPGNVDHVDRVQRDGRQFEEEKHLVNDDRTKDVHYSWYAVQSSYY